MGYDSPLRYPGGKVSLAPFLAKTIELNGLSGCSYFEPYAGGAGAALRLLREGVVSELRLNDFDPRISAFWKAALNEPQRFADAILSVPLSIAEWRRQRQICRSANRRMSFELGFAAFYLNRCNRSGVLFGAAPIGGYTQEGKWKIDARFNRKNLAERIFAISRHRKQIHVSNMDALAFLIKHLPRGGERKRVFAYLDPPYHSNGDRLYLNSYTNQNHINLARYIQRQNILRWVMSYDDTRFIRSLYTTCVTSHLPLQYSLQRKQQARELLIAPARVRLPAYVASINTNECEAASA